MWPDLWTERTPLFILAPLRVCCGYLALAGGLGKVGAGWLTLPLLRERLERMLAVARTTGATDVLLQRIVGHVLGHALAYSRLVTLIELIGGAALLVGLCSRYAALLLFVLTLAFLLGGGTTLLDNTLLLQGAALLTLSLCSSGRVLGVDALLRPHLPAWLT
jgi:uncharacterized membrane protein YphA (DoxX/SURF4 family)